jgi:hypothetical protein
MAHIGSRRRQWAAKQVARTQRDPEPPQRPALGFGLDAFADEVAPGLGREVDQPVGNARLGEGGRGK